MLIKIPCRHMSSRGQTLLCSYKLVPHCMKSITNNENIIFLLVVPFSSAMNFPLCLRVGKLSLVVSRMAPAHVPMIHEMFRSHSERQHGVANDNDTPDQVTTYSMRPVNERRRYFVTSPLIGWVHIQYGPCNSCQFYPGYFWEPIESLWGFSKYPG